jgi:putative ABC transport system permease protein
MAQQAFGGHDPIGKQLWINLGTDPVTVVGVVGHVRYWGLAGDDQSQVRAQLYYPFAQVPDRLVRRWSELMSIAVRTGGDPMTEVAPLRRAIRGDANDQVIYDVRTLEELASASLAPQRFLLLLFGSFAGLALLLACIGIYGVLAYLTSERIPEMAMRMVLGASPGRVMRLVLRGSLVMIGLGVAAGLAGTYAAGRVLERLVEGVLPTGPSTVVMTILLLSLAALLASVLPARRASRVDPARVLR